MCIRDRYKSIFEVVHEGLDAKKDDHQEYEVKAILTKLGIVDLNQSIATLSGGQLKRVALACVLMLSLIHIYSAVFKKDYHRHEAGGLALFLHWLGFF